MAPVTPLLFGLCPLVYSQISCGVVVRPGGVV